MGFHSAAKSGHLAWYLIVVYMLAGFGGLVLGLRATKLVLDETGPLVYEVRRSWADFKRHATTPLDANEHAPTSSDPPGAAVEPAVPTCDVSTPATR